MDMSFKTFLRIAEAGGAVVLPTSWTGSSAPDTLSLSGHPPTLPGLDLGMPSVTRSGQIVHIIKDRNPIYVQLSDGSKLFFTLDEFRRIKGSPEQGRTMTVVFQRNGNDTSQQASQIQSCTVS